MINSFKLAGFAGIIFFLTISVLTTQVENNAYAQYTLDLEKKADKHAKHLNKVLSVAGSASTSQVSDQLVIRFGVETQEKTAKQSLNTNSNLMNNIIDSIKRVGITEDEISTSRFNLYPVYEGHERDGVWKEELVGYKVINSIIITTDKLDSTANIIDAAVEAGANRVDAVNFLVSSEKQLQIKNDLIEEAILDAKAKAEKALTPLDHKIVGVMKVSLSDHDSYTHSLNMGYGIPFMEASFAKSAYSDTPIFDSDQKITVVVNVVFLIDRN